MSLFRTESVVIQRKAAEPTYVNGELVPGADGAPFSAFASVQPVPAKEIEMLPAGDREKSPVKIWTKTELFNGDVMTRTTGEIFEVVSVANWQQVGRVSSHYEAMALKVNPA